jgi:hypothetical protein
MPYDSSSEAPQRNDAMQARGAKAKEAADRAFKRRAVFDPLFQAQAEIFYPERADFTMQYSDANERYDGLITSEPMMMRRDMAHNLGAMVRPRGKDWFKASAYPDSVMEDDDAKIWCEEATKTMRNIIYSPAANFTAAMAQSDHDYVTFGNAVIAHPYNSDQTGIIFSCLHLRDCAWSKNADGKTDMMHNKMKLSLRQIVHLFGLHTLPKEWKDEWDKGHKDVKKELLRCVVPMDESDYDDKKERRLRDAQFSSMYVACDVKDYATLASREFMSFPFTVREWMSVSGEDYARSPCTSVALADARTLNIAEEALLTGIELKVRPAQYVRKNLLEGNLSQQAGSITYVSEDFDERMGAPIKNIESGDPRYGLEFTERAAERMGRAFFQNLLKLPEGDMTAFEVSERIEMYTREAAPIFEPMEAENANIMDSVFVRAMAKGAFGDVMPDGAIDGLPEALQGADIRFEFETPLSDALKKLKANQFDQVLGRATALLQTEHPDAISALDNIDWDPAFREAMDGMAPVKWQKKREDVAAIRQQRAEAADAAKKEAQAMELGQTALKAPTDNLKLAAKAMQGEEIV